MKITSIDVMKIPSPDVSFSGNGGGSTEEWSPIIVRINTDEGIAGFGEAGLAYGKGWRAGYGMVQDFARTIIGEDPMNIEKIWDKLQRTTYWGIAGGVVPNAAISAIDIALWDIKGKYYRTPVYQLLGGKTNDHLRAYASQLQYNWGTAPDPDLPKLSTPEEYADVARRVKAEGFTALKFDPIMWGDDPKKPWNTKGPLNHREIKVAYDRVKAIRDAVGPDFDIIIDMHANTDTTAAIEYAHAFEPLHILYYEEPVDPMNPNFYKIVRDNMPEDMAIAGGERTFTRWRFRQMLEDRSIDIVQPDLTLAGGITETKKICDMAYTYDINAQVHVCGSPIAIAAALQVEAVIPNFYIHEVYQRAMYTKDRAAAVYDDLVPVNGQVKVPDRPGIGQELKPDIIKQSLVQTID